MAKWQDGDGVVEFPDGSRVRGRGLLAAPPVGLDPEFGVYLLGRAPRIDGWSSRWVRWRDFQLPESTTDALQALREVHERAWTERVEIACEGGMGRTGTGLAVLAMMSRIPTEDAVAWVRENYHPRAVETRRQERWINSVSSLLRA